MEKNKIIGIVGLACAAGIGVGVYLWQRKKSESESKKESLKNEPKKEKVEKTKIPEEFVEAIEAMKSKDETYPKISHAWIHRDPHTNEVVAVTIDKAIANAKTVEELGYMTITKSGNVIYSPHKKPPKLLTDEKRNCQSAVLKAYWKLGGWKSGYSIRDGGSALYKDGKLVCKCEECNKL